MKKRTRRRYSVRPKRTTTSKYDFKSKLELTVFKKLKKIKRIKVDYETVKLPYTLQKNYLPDFVITRSDGTIMYIEVKGYLRPEDRTKAIAVQKANGPIDLRFVFSKDNLIHRKSKTRYSDWCKKHGFTYAIADDIPKEWFNG